MTSPQRPKVNGSGSAGSSRRIVIAGGTGFLGLNLAEALRESGYSVVLLSRHAPGDSEWTHHSWDARSLGPWAEAVDGAHAVVNLAGRTVDCIKTPDHCDEILRSRVESTRVLGKAVQRARNPPRVWVQMSTAHRYGDPPEVVCTEDSAFGYGLAPVVGEAWEAEHERALIPGVRGVVLRTSFVLGRDGGAFPQLATMARLGLGGKAGHGRQGISWIHERDMNRIFLRAIENEDVSGPYIATAPTPVSNAEFMRQLRRRVGAWIALPAPGPLIRFGARFVLRTDPELILYGRYCVPARLLEEGFEFTFPDLDAALEDLVRSRGPVEARKPESP